MESIKNKTFVLSLHYNGDNSYLFVNGVEQIKFKAEDSQIKPYPLCLGNISKDFSSTNAQKTGLHGYVYDFSVDYDAIGNDKILDIHKYLMKKKNNIIKSVWCYKKNIIGSIDIECKFFKVHFNEKSKM